MKSDRLWKPKEGEYYYAVYPHMIYKEIWENGWEDKFNFQHYRICKTRKEAKAKFEAIKKILRGK